MDFISVSEFAVFTESDVWFNAYVNSDGKGAVTAQSSKKLSFRRDDTGTILGIAPMEGCKEIGR